MGLCMSDHTLYSTASAPTLEYLVSEKILTKISTNWRTIGIHFGLSLAELDNFERRAMLDNYRCCTDVFNHWIQNDGHEPKYPLSWRGLYDLLCHIEHRSTAEDLRRKLSNDGIRIQ